jgi:hypothetical protein
MKHNFEERKNNRIQNATKQAGKNEKKSQELAEQAKEMASVIPPGQPILVGHHSENRDRNYRKKIGNKWSQVVEAEKKAEFYADKAESIAKNDAIYSDDPDALPKLRQKLADCEANHAFMRASDKFLRNSDKEGFLKVSGASVKLSDQLSAINSYTHTGFPGFAFKNSRAEIDRLKKRIAYLEAQSANKTKETVINGVRLVENVEANRVQLFFENIPSEDIRKKLKGNGFRWCPTEGAWQRHLSPVASAIAKSILNQL